MGLYDSSMVRGGLEFKVDIKRDYRGDIGVYFREYFREHLIWS